MEAGPGEGSLAAQLAEELMVGWPQLAERLELVLVEPNAGMAARQRQRLEGCPLPVRWSGFAEMAAAPLTGVVLAHEVLDALAVERIERSGTHWCRQQVTLRKGTLRLEPGEPLEPEDGARLEPLGLLPLDQRRPEGWCSELHPGLAPWMAGCGAALAQGRLLVIDYALEAWRYYAPQRSNGTLMAYRAQQASSDPLLQPGEWDLTAHLCLESVLEAAAAAGWQVLGQTRQGRPCSPSVWPSGCMGCSSSRRAAPPRATGALVPRIWRSCWPGVRPCCAWWIPLPSATSAGWPSAGARPPRRWPPARTCSCRIPGRARNLP